MIRAKSIQVESAVIKAKSIQVEYAAMKINSIPEKYAVVKAMLIQVPSVQNVSIKIFKQIHLFINTSK